ncbi:MAG: hypothetical protein PHH30_07425 [Bacteroidales bacterium]|nr:hypothetical protein [Bacteroidales bacterium]
MKTILTFLLVTTLVLSYGQTINKLDLRQDSVNGKQIQSSSEHLIYKGSLVELYVEKTIFHSATDSNFLIKFTIKNISDKTVGIDLTDYWRVVYPNQWGIYNKPYRELIDEEQIIPDKTINKTEILNKYRDNSLTMISPDETLDYYRDWNGSGEKVDLKNKDEYLIISVDGQLLLTNGEQLEHITLNEVDNTLRDIVISYPLNHKTIPEKSVIIKH